MPKNHPAFFSCPPLPSLLWAAINFAVVSWIVHTLGAILTMSYYTDPKYFSLWSPLMMPSNGPPGGAFYVASFAVSLAIGIIFAIFYHSLKTSLPGQGRRKGIAYGFLLFGLAGVPFTLTILMLFAVPLPLLLGWAAESLVIYLVSGMLYAGILGE